MAKIFELIRGQAKLLGLVAGLAIFGFWMNIVGNPHVAETSIGVLISIGVGLFVWYKLSKLGDSN